MAVANTAQEHSKWFLDFQPPRARLKQVKSVDVINSEVEKLSDLGKLMKKARESKLHTVQMTWRI